MDTLSIDANNNLIVGNNSLSLKKNLEACAQDAKTRVGLCLGENQFNLNEGIDYDNEVLGTTGGKNYFQSAIVNRLMASDEVRSVFGVNIEKNGNELQVETSVDTIYGVLRL